MDVNSQTSVDAQNLNELTQEEKNSCLIEAAGNGNTDLVAQLLTERADINAIDQDGYTALINAAQNNHDAVVRLLINAQANIEIIVNRNGNTALIEALINNAESIVTQLISAGADLEVVHRYGKTALIRAARNGDTDLVAQLIQRGANLKAVDQNGNSALMAAALSGCAATVELLIVGGEDLELTNNTGNTALALSGTKNTEEYREVSALLLGAMSEAQRNAVSHSANLLTQHVMRRHLNAMQDQVNLIMGVYIGAFSTQNQDRNFLYGLLPEGPRENILSFLFPKRYDFRACLNTIQMNALSPISELLNGAMARR